VHCLLRFSLKLQENESKTVLKIEGSGKRMMEIQYCKVLQEALDEYVFVFLLLFSIWVVMFKLELVS